MSAYGPPASRVPSAQLPPLTLPLTTTTSSPHTHLTIHHLPSPLSAPPALLALLFKIFSDVLEEGRTYPQLASGMDRAGFEGYFGTADLFVGVLGGEGGRALESVGEAEWEEVLGGYYYVKPNYPGRSSHICNAGFVVPPSRRGLKLGNNLGQSYLHFAPQLGYKASVFNLVYTTNRASLAIWERLGFTRLGLIRRAGKLKTVDGTGEEYADAAIIYKSFE